VCDLEVLPVLVLHLAGLAIDGVVTAGRSVHVLAWACASEAACPGWGVLSRRVHSRYQRRLADTASGAQALQSRPVVATRILTVPKPDAPTQPDG
jgi:hypothetical protein